MKNKQKEKIINEFRKRFVDYFEEGSLTYEIEGVDSFLSKALDSIREETLGNVMDELWEKAQEDEKSFGKAYSHIVKKFHLIKFINKLKTKGGK